MNAVSMNNLWTYIQGMSLKKKDREWLAGKLLEPTADDAKTVRQKAGEKVAIPCLFNHIFLAVLDVNGAGL